MNFFKLCVVGFFVSLKSYGQSDSLLIGTLENNFTHFKQDKNAPYFGTILFYKSKNKWDVLSDNISLRKQSFNIYYRGLKIGTVVSKGEIVSNQPAHFWYPSKISSKKIPKVGNKSHEFAGMDAGDEKCYRPLIISSSIGTSQKPALKHRKPNNNDSLLLIKYLIETARKLNLGSLTGNIIKSVNRVLVIRKDCYLVDADINLNMFCYKNRIPFDADSSYFLSSTEKYTISQTKQTPNSYFLFNNGEVSYVDYGLKYLDSEDFDKDGYEEIIFRMDKYNYTGYLLLTNKWKDFITSSWTYH